MLVNVTAPVAPLTLIPVLATAEVTPVFVIVNSSVDVPASVDIPVPPVNVAVFPEDIVWLEPLSPAYDQET